jgi:hypothetical protein
MAVRMQPGTEDEGPAQGRHWDELSAEERAYYVHRDVQIIIEESRAATKQIVAAAMKDFEEDYARIKSPLMRMSVLRNITDGAHDVGAPSPTSAVQVAKTQTSTLHSVAWFLQLIGLG